MIGDRSVDQTLADAAYEFVEAVIKASSLHGLPSGFDRVSAIVTAADRSPAEAVRRFTAAGILSSQLDPATLRGLATLAVEGAAAILIAMTPGARASGE